MEFKFDGADQNGFKVDFSAIPKREKKPRKAIGSKGKRMAINLLVTLLAVILYRSYCRTQIGGR